MSEPVQSGSGVRTNLGVPVRNSLRIDSEWYGLVTIVCHILTDVTREGEPYVPPTKPYELSALATDLVLYARYALKPGGRLVFFLPTVTEEYEELDLQTMLCDGMEVVANSLQNFGSWGRRVRSSFMQNMHLMLTINVHVAYNHPQSDVR